MRAPCSIPFEQYLALDAINMSTLLELEKSPAHYRHILEHGRPDADHFRIGRALHTAVLEPGKYGSTYTLWRNHEDGRTRRRRGKAWDEFQLANAGLTILTEKQHADAMRMAAAVAENSHAQDWLSGNGQAELTLQWRDDETGLQCKCRVDWLRDGLLIDLKSARDATPRHFGKTAGALRYHARMAFYADAIETITGTPPSTVGFVVVEKTEPHAVACYRMTEHQLRMGRLLYRELLHTVAECRIHDRWPGIATEVLELDIPDYLLDFGDQTLDFEGIEVVA